MLNVYSGTTMASSTVITHHSSLINIKPNIADQPQTLRDLVKRFALLYLFSILIAFLLLDIGILFLYFSFLTPIFVLFILYSAGFLDRYAILHQSSYFSQDSCPVCVLSSISSIFFLFILKLNVIIANFGLIKFLYLVTNSFSCNSN
uniref:Uncharacterized protein n=1 Tax=Cacopsylla melanoneura TaxID=428564 RepID=A0A8D8ZL91_9HEMI